MRRSLGLYIHIPFCRQKCAYCDFYSLARSQDAMAQYQSVLAEDLVSRAPSAREYTVDTVYFGGGTPSYFGAARLASLLETVKAHYTLAEDCEITAEANPESARNAADLRLLRTAGFNRLSFGMQSSDENELRMLGRIHRFAQVKEAVETAREAGFANISLDLMYGLPDQTAQTWQKSLADAVSLAPEHLSCYALKVEEGTPLAAKKISLPNDEMQAEFYLAAVSYLEQNGYAQYEISNFAREGKFSRHNMKYWILGEYLGFGPGAHSDFGGERFAVSRDLSAYLCGEHTESERAVIPPQERERERVMLGLRTARGIEDDARIAAARDFLRKCEKEHLAASENGFWHLTPQGFLVSNAIILGVLERI